MIANARKPNDVMVVNPCGIICTENISDTRITALKFKHKFRNVSQKLQVNKFTFLVRTLDS